ncbi:hypothetical protein IID27_03500, partial [Patescibacteria group bacterium]|nr:hypothetical protein [Patescibacteria group bacterium]
MQIKKILKFLSVLILAVSWIFSGWPQIWQNPPFPSEVKEVRAGHCGSSPCTITSTETFTVPTGITSLTIKARGGGAAGSNGQSNKADRSGGGGGGGAYTECTVAVTAESGYTVTVGVAVSD